MRLAGPRLAYEMYNLMAIDEVELSEGENPVAVERGLEREVEAGQRLDGVQQGRDMMQYLMKLLERQIFLSCVW